MLCTHMGLGGGFSTLGRLLLSNYNTFFYPNSSSPTISAHGATKRGVARAQQQHWLL